MQTVKSNNSTSGRIMCDFLGNISQFAQPTPPHKKSLRERYAEIQATVQLHVHLLLGHLVSDDDVDCHLSSLHKVDTSRPAYEAARNTSQQYHRTLLAVFRRRLADIILDVVK